MFLRQVGSFFRQFLFLGEKNSKFRNINVNKSHLIIITKTQMNSKILLLTLFSTILMLSSCQKLPGGDLGGSKTPPPNPTNTNTYQYKTLKVDPKISNVNSLGNNMDDNHNVVVNYWKYALDNQVQAFLVDQWKLLRSLINSRSKTLIDQYITGQCNGLNYVYLLKDINALICSNNPNLYDGTGTTVDPNYQPVAMYASRLVVNHDPVCYFTYEQKVQIKQCINQMLQYDIEDVDLYLK